MQCLPRSGAAAQRLAQQLKLPLYTIDLHRFPDRELRVTVGEPASTTIVFASLPDPNDKLIALMFAAEALRRGGARRLVLVCPYLCYMRQDSAFHEGEAVSQKVIGRLLATSFDRVVTVSAHLHRTKDIGAVFPGIEAADVSAIPAIADALRKAAIEATTLIVGPDEESRPWVSDLAQRLGLAHAVASKSRRGDRAVEIQFPDPAFLRDRPALLIDDIVSSGGTLAACAAALRAAGCGSIDAVVVHALFSSDVEQNLRDAGIRTIRSTDSVPHPTNVVALDSALADALRGELAA